MYVARNPGATASTRPSDRLIRSPAEVLEPRRFAAPLVDSSPATRSLVPRRYPQATPRALGRPRPAHSRDTPHPPHREHQDVRSTPRDRPAQLSIGRSFGMSPNAKTPAASMPFVLHQTSSAAALVTPAALISASPEAPD